MGLEAQEPGGSHGNARATRAGYERQDLGDADDQGARCGHVIHVSDRHAQSVGEKQDDTEAQHGPTDDFRRAPGIDDVVIGGQPARDDNGNRADDQIDCQAAGLGAAAAHQVQQSGEHLSHVTPEINDDGQQRADVNGDIKGQSLVGPIGQNGDQDKMARRRDGEEFCDPLDDGQCDDMKQAQKDLSDGSGCGRACFAEVVYCL